MSTESPGTINYITVLYRYKLLATGTLSHKFVRSPCFLLLSAVN